MSYKIPDKILFNKNEISSKVQELGELITKDYSKICNDENPLVALCILKGSFVFFSELIREIKLPLICEFMGVSSYGNSTESSGEVRLTLDLQGSIHSKNVLIIEDIIDTGLTMEFLIRTLEARKPASIKTCSLLYKPSSMKTGTKPEFCGFEIAEQFAVGYGVDFANKYRELPFIAELDR